MTSPEADDVALKFLHTADWHLGKKFSKFDPEDQLKLSRARLEVLDLIFQTAHQHSVDAILCAGDLFDEPTPEPQWWEGLAAKLKAAPGTCPIFLLPGNHDPLIPGSVYDPTHAFRRRLPARVHVIDQDDYSFRLNDLSVLYAKPCRSQAGQEDPTRSLPAREPDDTRIRIGMVHGSTFDAVDCQLSFPIAKDAAAARGFDYLAIGDTHSYRCVPPGAVPPVVYPGAPEPTNFGEVDAGKVVVGFVTRSRRVKYQPETVAAWTWSQRTVRSLSELRAILLDKRLSKTVLRLILEMRVTAPEMEEATRILGELKGTSATHGKAGVLQLERKGLQLDSRDIAKDLRNVPEVLQTTLRSLQAMEGTEQEEVARQALYHLYRLIREARPS